MKATGLGIQLSPIRMFIPLLISESCWRMMAENVIEFKKNMQNKEFNFLLKFDFYGSVDFFPNLSKQIAQNFKLIVPYSRSYERRQNNCLVSYLFGEISQECGTQFHINQYQQCKDQDCTNTIIIQGCSNDPKNILKAAKELTDVTLSSVDSGSILKRFISFEEQPEISKKLFTDTNPQDFIADNLEMTEGEYEDTLRKYSNISLKT